jgi:hypothetical protein
MYVAYVNIGQIRHERNDPCLCGGVYVKKALKQLVKLNCSRRYEFWLREPHPLNKIASPPQKKRAEIILIIL